jgi:hypothetical protein
MFLRCDDAVGGAQTLAANDIKWKRHPASSEEPGWLFYFAVISALIITSFSSSCPEP